MLDVDFFKTVNDTYGHLAGDQVLKSLAAIIQRATRAADIAARYGGEEFAVLLPNTDLAGAIRCAEHLWETIGTAEIETGQGLLRLTVSVGVAALDPDVKDEEDLCRRADAALLAAKRRGRNNVYAWDQLLLEPDQAVPILDSSDPEELRNNLNRLIAPAKAKYIEAVRPLMESLCQRDPELQRQTTNITIFALELARAAGMSAEETEALHRAALFHVIAHAATPAGQSHEPRAPVLCSRLLPEYATPGEKLVRGLGVFELEMEYLRHYCERWDGSGGPDGLTGKAIPLGARILAIATTYHALLTGAAGRGPVDEKKALAELRRHAGTRFDPDLVEMFVEARVAVSIL